jgi:hypothetical protein
MADWLKRYWKLIGVTVGDLVAILVVYLATKGYGTCDPTGETCKLGGYDAAAITAGVMFVLNKVAAYAFPANKLTPTQLSDQLQEQKKL